MEPIRPSRGKARGRPQFPIIQPGVSNLPPQGIRGPRPTISQPIPSSQPLQTPVTGTMPRPPRSMPPRPTGGPQQRAPRPLGLRSGMSTDNLPRPGMSTDNLPRPGMSSDNVPRPGMSADTAAFKQDPMAGVRIYQNLILFTYIFICNFF